MTDHSPENHIEGPAAVPDSSLPLPEVPFPAENRGRLACEADGQQETADRRMTPEEGVAALQVAKGLVDSAYAACTEAISAFENDGPVLVAEAQGRLHTYCLPKYNHQPSFRAGTAGCGRDRTLVTTQRPVRSFACFRLNDYGRRDMEVDGCDIKANTGASLPSHSSNGYRGRLCPDHSGS